MPGKPLNIAGKRRNCSLLLQNGSARFHPDKPDGCIHENFFLHLPCLFSQAYFIKYRRVAMQLKTFLFCLFLLFYKCPYAQQYDYLLHKDYAQRSPLLFPFYIDTLVSKYANPDAALQKIHALETAAKKADDNDLLLETVLMKAHAGYHHNLLPPEKVIQLLDSLQAAAGKTNKYWLAARIESLEAFIYFDKGYNYELSFLHYQKLDDILQKLSVEAFPEKQACYYQISYAYYFFADYNNTVKYGKEALKFTPRARYAKYIVQTANNIGLSFQKLRQYDSANYYFQLAYDSELDYNGSKRAWYGISRGNIGNSYFLQKKYTEAKPLLQTDVHIAKENRDWGLAVGSLVPLGTIALDEGQITLAAKYLQEALACTRLSGQYRRYEKLYPQLARLASIQGNTTLAMAYTDSAFAVKDSLARKFNALQITRALQKADLEKYQASLQKMENEKQRKLAQRNLLIAGLMMLLITTVWVLQEQKRKVKNKQAALKNAEQQLQSFLKKIADSNALIESLQSQMNGANEDAIARLQQSTILNEEEWTTFRAAFEKLNPGFLTRLKEKMPDLSPAEIRFVVLTRLQFSNKEMAATLGVGPEAIRQYRSRLRKKLSLDAAANIEDIISNI